MTFGLFVLHMHRIYMYNICTTNANYDVTTAEGCISTTMITQTANYFSGNQIL